MVRAITLWIEDIITPFQCMDLKSWIIVLGFFIIESVWVVLLGISFIKLWG